MRTTRRRVVGVAVLVLVVGAGGVVIGPPDSGSQSERVVDTADGTTSFSAGGGVAADGEARKKRMTATPAPATEDLSTSGSSTGETVLEPTERARIKTGELRLQVGAFETARHALASTVRQNGGYVSDVRRRQHRSGNRTWTTGAVTLRVPAENFSRVRQRASAAGRLIDEEISTRDVSEQLVDVNARLENRKRQRDRLRALYDRAEETEELLAIEGQLSDVQGTIERLEARRNELRRSVRYATLRVELREPEPGTSRIAPPAYHERPLLEALVASVGGVVVLGRSAAVTLAYALPYLVVLGLLSMPAVVWRRWRR